MSVQVGDALAPGYLDVLASFVHAAVAQSRAAAESVEIRNVAES